MTASSTNSILLAIKPQFVDRIFENTKRYEYRRQVPKRLVTRIFIYESSPVSRIVGWALVSSVVSDTPSVLYEKTAKYAGIAQDAFEAYFSNKLLAHAFVLSKPYRLSHDVGLSTIRFLLTICYNLSRKRIFAETSILLSYERIPLIMTDELNGFDLDEGGSYADLCGIDPKQITDIETLEALEDIVSESTQKLRYSYLANSGNISLPFSYNVVRGTVASQSVVKKPISEILELLGKLETGLQISLYDAHHQSHDNDTEIGH